MFPTTYGQRERAGRKLAKKRGAMRANGKSFFETVHQISMINSYFILQSFDGAGNCGGMDPVKCSHFCDSGLFGFNFVLCC